MPRQSSFVSASLPRHLARGALGFGLIAAAIALATSVGWEALLLAPAGMVALRGCPMCWTIGLIETLAAGRLQRDCDARGCTLRSAQATSPTRSASACSAATGPQSFAIE